MFDSVNVIGRGRVGSAIAARLAERGVELREDAELTLLCVPDTAIADVSQGLSLGLGWIAHVSGATPLAALDPHERRFGMHPLQTFTRARGPEQLDGAWAAVSGETPEALERGVWLAETLGLRPFELADSDRVRYHAAAVIASNHLVALLGQVERLATTFSVPFEAFAPLVRASVQNAFALGPADALTGPVARGDLATVEQHLRDLDPGERDAYRALAREAARLTGRRDTGLDRLLGDLRLPPGAAGAE